jgi:serine phosphatase RsbU (regulator of sigma subunit)
MNKQILIAKPTNFLVKLVGLFLFFFALISIVQGIFSLRVSLNWGQFGINMNTSDNKEYILIIRVVPGSNAEAAGLKKGDRIIQINGQNINEKNIDTIWGDSLAGSALRLKISRGKRQLDIKMSRRLLPLIDRVLRLIFIFVLPILMLGYILVGMWGLFKQPSFVTKIIAAVCFSFGSLPAAINMGTVTTPMATYLHYYDVKTIIGGISLFLAPALWVFLFINFPQKTPYYKKHKFLSLIFIFIIPLLAITLLLIFPKFMANFKYTVQIFSIFMITFIVFGIIILSRGARNEQSVLKQRQYKLMLFGIKYGALSILSGFICLAVYATFMSTWADYFGWAAFIIFLVTQIMGLILPFTFLNSFFKNKILETEGALKRRLRFLAASFSLFFVYLFTAFMFGNWIIKKYKLTDPSFIVLLILLLSLTFSPINSRIIHWLGEKLYPEKTKYKRSLRNLIKKISVLFEESQIRENLSNWITETMGIYPALVFPLDKIGQMNLPFKINSPKSVLAKTRNGSIFFWDEIQDEKGLVDEDEQKWAKQKEISITIPLISRGEQIALLNIGKKKNQEDFTGDDLEIFNEAASQIALAMQNIKLQAEYLEKKRLDKELEVARDIQNHLMPRKIPQLKDMQIHGEYKPCHEVGGDYFDIIPLGTDRTALVIADVSGKGAGAALLMSSLQASLKISLRLSLTLNEIASEINEMIYENSLPSQFITFFICVWDSAAKNLEYINAGHNPPLIISSHGKINKLGRTGKGLGIRKNQRYRTKNIRMNIGDLLVLYTDGIEDLYNARLESFGYDRLVNVILEEKDRPPQAIIRSLLQKLNTHAPSPQYGDDITIIVARRIK